ncbi:hypothetical protein K6119_03715 [Paracrocinitomix mangrovi]|uniref:hypothetical protein n=1 Tax=Paracrocinitomix mangrovi TaxID=2862509 RepID=UPI001C8E441E|nr:hypothetical protein [Paracrocinitomix mangrovi]UKN02618.1 hypothetical protein K6119_03715 [Paracrocinitomix mangrovi]
MSILISLMASVLALFSCGEEGEPIESDTIELVNEDHADHQDDTLIFKDIIPFSVDTCDKTSIEDWDNFLGIPYGASEFALDSILGNTNGATYMNDSMNFVMYYREVPGAPISVWTSAKTARVEIIYLEVTGIEPYFQSDIDSVVTRYNIPECDAQWLGMTEKEVIEKMGEPRKSNETELKQDVIKTIMYDAEDFSKSVSFIFYKSQDYKCSAISVNWFY